MNNNPAATYRPNDFGPDPGGPYQPYDWSSGTQPQDAPYDARRISRTPSPTPSEAAELKRTTLIDWSVFRNKQFWLQRNTIIWCIAGLLAVVLGALFYFYHDQIVKALQPAANWMHALPAGFLIPIAIFFVISFPPLFGHEILAILCGLVWGVGVGFAITAAGTFIGEIGNFYAFKYCCHARGEKLEQSDVKYACLAKLVREGGFKIAVIARYSAIPGHFTTAIFAVCGMDILTFCAAAFLSLPKQFVTVYIGVLLEDTNSADNTKNTILSYVVGTITFVVTIAAMHYIQRQVNKVKPDIIYQRRKARQAKMERAGSLYQNGGVLESTADVVFNPNSSDTDVPLTGSDQPYDPPYQQWDSAGRAVGYSRDPRMYAPQPRRGDNPLASARMLSDDATRDAQTPLRQESTDTVTWETENNAAQGPGQSFRLNSLPPSEPLRNPFQESTETVHQVSYAPPSGPPPRVQSPTQYASYGAEPPSTSPLPTPPFGAMSPQAPGGASTYAFGSPQHSFGSPRVPQPRVTSPPPPSYRTAAQ